MLQFEFANDEASRIFCNEIVLYIREKYDLNPDECLKYVQQHWHGQPFEGEYDMRYHELPSTWGDHIHKHHDYLFGGKPSA